MAGVAGVTRLASAITTSQRCFTPIADALLRCQINGALLG
jgi:hypothetical protein